MVDMIYKQNTSRYSEPNNNVVATIGREVNYTFSMQFSIIIHNFTSEILVEACILYMKILFNIWPIWWLIADFNSVKYYK